jgi:tetratricopeptide (TPR) repeat protein
MFNLFSKSKLAISKDDQTWVEESYENIIQAFGYPVTGIKIQEIDSVLLPKCFQFNAFTVENITEDLCAHFKIEFSLFSFQILDDIRDSGLEFLSEGKEFETEILISEDKYVLCIAKAELDRKERLVYLVAKELLCFLLTKSFADYNKKDDDGLFAYIVAICFGFGPLFSEHLIDIGTEYTNDRKITWTNYSDMPPEIFGYALAYYVKLVDDATPWAESLPKEVREQFVLAEEYFLKSKISLYNKRELDASNFLEESITAFNNGDWDVSKKLAEKGLFLTKDPYRKADFNNSIGYVHQMRKDYNLAIPFYDRSLAYNPHYAYAFDNKGFCFIQLGELEQGRYCVEQAIKTQGNDDGYSFRNLALYYWKKGEQNEAERYFQKAFEYKARKVDLLTELYEEFKNSTIQ